MKISEESLYILIAQTKKERRYRSELSMFSLSIMLSNYLTLAVLKVKFMERFSRHCLEKFMYLIKQFVEELAGELVKIGDLHQILSIQQINSTGNSTTTDHNLMMNKLQ